MSTIGNLTDTIAEIRDRLPEPASSNLQASTAQATDVVQDALDELGKAKPRRLVSDTVGDGATKRFVLTALLAVSEKEWVDEVSELELIEIVNDPDTDDESILELSDDAWEIRRSAAGADVLFLDSTVATTRTMRVHYSRPHAVDGLDSATATTVPDALADVFLGLGQAGLARWIWAKASETQNQALGIDDVELDSLATRYKDLWESLREIALNRLVSPELAGGAAGHAQDWDADLAIAKVARVSH